MSYKFNKLGFLFALLFSSNNCVAEQFELDLQSRLAISAETISIEELYAKVYKCYFSWAAIRQIMTFGFRVESEIQPMRSVSTVVWTTVDIAVLLVVIISICVLCKKCSDFKVPAICGLFSVGGYVLIRLIANTILSFFIDGGRNNPLAKAFTNEIIKAIASGKRVVSVIPEIQSILDIISKRLISGKQFSDFERVALGRDLSALVGRKLGIAEALKPVC